MAEDSRETLRIRSSGHGENDPIELRQVTELYGKPIVLARDIVRLVGSTVNEGSSRNDVDMVIKDTALSETVAHVLRFRLGRAAPPDLSERLSFHSSDEFPAGPFTDHVPLYDLVAWPRSPEIIRMRAPVAKQDNPLLDLPEQPGKRDAVFQLHFRGKSVHGDLRMAVNGHLVGWTLANQVAGKVPDVNTVAQARAVARGWSKEGDAAFKDWTAPAKLFASPKARQPKVWLKIDGEVFEPGEVGATANEAGVIVVAARPKVEFGFLKPFAAEYFLTGDPKLSGRLFFRMLTGEGGAPLSEDEAGRRTAEGRPFWTSWFTKDLVPSVVTRRAVKTKTMPPDGWSAMPTSLMRQTPKEFRFWEAKGTKARAMRDALVEEKFFTPGNVRLVDNEIVRVVQKLYVYHLDPDVVVNLRKQRAVKFALSWQFWKGQQVVRAAPSRQVWHLVFDKSGAGLDTFVLQKDPLGNKQISARRTPRKEKALLTFDGPAPPGEKIGGEVLNDTKATPSSVLMQDTGKAELLDVQPSFLKVRFKGKKLKSIWTLVAEEPGSDVWLMTEGEEPGRAIPTEKQVPTRGDFQVWDPKRKTPADRTELAPLALYQPMKPSGPNAFRDVDSVLREFATPTALKDGVFVEPKLNGFRVSVQRKGDKAVMFTEEVFTSKEGFRDLFAGIPGARAEALKLPGPYVLDAEFVAMDESGDPVPRRDLAQFRGNQPVPDAGVRLFVFDSLFLPGAKNLTARPLDETRKLLATYFRNAPALRRIKLLPTRLVKTEKQLRDAVKWASAFPGSEGAMFKAAASTYSLGGQTSSWAKLKLARRLKAIVWKRDPVKDTPGTWTFFGALGPVSDAEAEKWGDVVEVDGRKYVAVGRTFNRKLAANIGDVIEVEFTEILHDTSKDKPTLRWFTPTVIDIVSGAPDKPRDALALLQPGETKKDFLFEESSDVFTPEYVVKLARSGGEEQTALGIVLEPNDGADGQPLDPDAQKDVYSEAEVRQAAHGWMRKYRLGKGYVGYMHNQPLKDTEAMVLENYLAPADFVVEGRRVRKGTWLQTVWFPLKALWVRVKSGELSGLSIGGRARRAPVA